MNDLNHLFHELHQTVRFVSKEVNDRLQGHGLYQSQWSILFCLKRFGPMTQTELWRYLNVEAPTVTRTLERLEKNRWILRCKGTDKRARIVQLTEKAVQELPSIEKTISHFENDMTSGLTPAEQEQLLVLLRKVGPPVRSTREDDQDG